MPLRPVVAKMIASAEDLAEARAGQIRAAALSELRESLGSELERLRALSKMNDHVRPGEIHELVEERAALEHHVAESRLRMDAVRLIWKGPIDA